MNLTMIYLIKPLDTQYGRDYNLGEKPQLGIYIAKNKAERDRIKSDLRSKGFRKIKIDEVDLTSLAYIPLLYRQSLK